MRSILFSQTGMVRPILTAILVAAGLALGTTARAQVVNLSDNNSTALVDTTSGAGLGMMNWTVDGIDHLRQQWFWYRLVTDNREYSIDTLGAPVIVTPNARTLNLTYSAALLSIRVDYLLTGGTAGSGLSQINESVTVMNLSGSPLGLRFFQFSDFNLNGVPAGDTVALGQNVMLKYNEAVQTKGGLSFSETAVTPGADRGQAALAPVLINSLTDGAPTTLSNFAGPVGPGDATWAFEWDITIPIGGSFVLSKVKNITAVPEPAAASLALLGLGVVGFLRRKR